MIIREMLTSQQIEYLEKVKKLEAGEVLLNGEVYEDNTEDIIFGDEPEE